MEYSNRLCDIRYLACVWLVSVLYIPWLDIHFQCVWRHFHALPHKHSFEKLLIVQIDIVNHHAYFVCICPFQLNAMASVEIWTMVVTGCDDCDDDKAQQLSVEDKNFHPEPNQIELELYCRFRLARNFCD